MSAAADPGEVTDGGSASAAADGVARLYADHAEAVLAVVLALRGSAADPEDVVQEAFMRAHRRWEEVARMAYPELWVQRVALNLATSRLRRLGSEARALARVGARSQETSTEVFGPDDEAFWELVRRLPAKQSRVVALRYAGDLTVAEIAVVLGVAEGTIRAQLYTARQRLAVLLGPSREPKAGR